MATFSSQCIFFFCKWTKTMTTSVLSITTISRLLLICSPAIDIRQSCRCAYFFCSSFHYILLLLFIAGSAMMELLH